MSRVVSVAFLCLLTTLWAGPVAAQANNGALQVGGQLVTVVSGEFDSTDVGFGGRIAWQPVPLLGVEGELTFYPADFADEPAFSGSRFEGLFGATVGPRLGQLRPFAKIRPGFVTFNDAPRPFACILIFPPPLACSLSGKTVFALDVGGGVEWLGPSRTFVRADIGDRILRYPSPVIDSGGAVRDSAFSSHDVRFAVGAGVRF